MIFYKKCQLINKAPGICLHIKPLLRIARTQSALYSMESWLLRSAKLKILYGKDGQNISLSMRGWRTIEINISQDHCCAFYALCFCPRKLNCAFVRSRLFNSSYGHRYKRSSSSYVCVCARGKYSDIKRNRLCYVPMVYNVQVAWLYNRHTQSISIENGCHRTNRTTSVVFRFRRQSVVLTLTDRQTDLDLGLDLIY